MICFFLGIHFSDASNGISRADYPNGYCLSAFDLTSDLSSDMEHWSPPKTGSMRIEMQFSKPLEETIVAVIFSEFENLIEIDHQRAISLDYSS